MFSTNSWRNPWHQTEQDGAGAGQCILDLQPARDGALGGEAGRRNKY